MGSNQKQNDSENVKIIIGKLLDKAAIPIRPVISAFHSVQARSAIIKRLDQFTVPLLESWIAFISVSELSCPPNVENVARTMLLTTNFRYRLFSTSLDVLKAPMIARGTECCTRHFPK